MIMTIIIFMRSLQYQMGGSFLRTGRRKGRIVIRSHPAVLRRVSQALLSSTRAFLGHRQNDSFRIRCILIGPKQVAPTTHLSHSGQVGWLVVRAGQAIQSSQAGRSGGSAGHAGGSGGQVMRAGRPCGPAGQVGRVGQADGRLRRQVSHGHLTLL